MYRITKGLDLPISGEPSQKIVQGPAVTRVGLVASDYIGLKPSMLVQQGDRVKLGQPLFEDKTNPGVLFTSPAAGVVSELNRGDRRAFLSMVVDIDGEESVSFQALAEKGLDAVNRRQLAEQLVQSGLWTSFRTRPYNKIPAVGSSPSSIFVQAMDTNPLAADPMLVIREQERDFQFGVQALTKLTEGKVFVCRRPAVMLPGDGSSGVQAAEFEGPHPAGLPGTHIHYLDPVGPAKIVWFINYQDVIAIGRLLSTGTLFTDRVLSVAGPAVVDPRVIRTRLGADIGQLVNGILAEGNARVISGSVLSGRAVVDPQGFLGRYDLQISVIAEGNQREFLGWMAPGFSKFSIRNVFASALDRARRFPFTSNTGGSRRAMVPIGMYEQVMPLDVLPTFLLRALITGDTEQAQALGCLELSEDDVALCTFVCPGKYEYGSLLRQRLSQIELEG